MQCCSRAWERRIRRHAETGWGGRGAAGWPVARRRAGSEGADDLRRGQHGDSEQEGKGRLTLRGVVWTTPSEARCAEPHQSSRGRAGELWCLEASRSVRQAAGGTSPDAAVGPTRYVCAVGGPFRGSRVTLDSHSASAAGRALDGPARPVGSSGRVTANPYLGGAAGGRARGSGAGPGPRGGPRPARTSDRRRASFAGFGNRTTRPYRDNYRSFRDRSRIVVEAHRPYLIG